MLPTWKECRCQLFAKAASLASAKVQASCGQLQRDAEHLEMQPEIQHEA